ncbi:phosphoribosylanthranilate isomerase [Halosimplex amylolyticum]|uniref:phosphoribosylanthranilate isomerase n=1 Tax=Halosimplex amylolyticum TaxID=3396616 RepID=UPI003F55DCD3
MSDVSDSIPGPRSSTRVKICGVTSATDRDAVVAAGADAVGVICDVPVDTPREVDEETAADLFDGVPPLVTGVLVTMPDGVDDAVTLAEALKPDAVQVHGGLSPSELGALGRRVSQDVVAAVDAEAEDVGAYAGEADALLVDSVDAEGGGGTGETHDWERTREIVADLDVPVILAGGLAPDNVAEAVETVRPFGVDVATGVERVDEAGDRVGGEKDRDAVEAFVANATREVTTA